MDAAPRRVIWGSDWPHIPDGGKDTGELLNLVATWVPDSEALNRLLVTNPAELFRFDE
jgi:predicted TIM-barrel fold metal-dependent hydrolase